MVGLSAHARHPASPFAALRFGATVISALVVLGALFGPTPAGAQQDHPATPEVCMLLSDLLGNAYGLPVDDEEFQRQLDDGSVRLAELRRVAPAELTEELDALEAFSSTVEEEVAAAGGIAGLSEAQTEDLSTRADAVLEPIETFFGRSCPGAFIEAMLYPECETDDGVFQPFLEVGNFSNDPVEVTAGEIEFTVGADDYDHRPVPADLQAKDVLIDGVAGLVKMGSCDYYAGPVAEDFVGFFEATFTPGCPADALPKPARLKIGLTAEGRESLDEMLELEPGPFPVTFEVDDVSVIATFPGGLDLALQADATVPVVSFDGAPIPVLVSDADCTPAENGQPSAPASPSSGPGSAVAAPLAPKFTG